MNNELKKWKKNCPICGNEQYYSTKGNLELAIKNNKICIKCRDKIHSKRMMGKLAGNKNPLHGVRQFGELNPFFGKRHTNEHRQIHSKFMKDYYKKYDNPFKGKHHSIDAKCKIGNANRGNNNAAKRQDIRKKIRLGVINYRKVNGLVDFIPNYNPLSISILEAKAKELGITDLQHAENGGEFYIEELGYWVDGYSKEKNIVIEYDETHHFDCTGNLKEKDIQRQKEIEDFLNCKFIRILK